MTQETYCQRQLRRKRKNSSKSQQDSNVQSELQPRSGMHCMKARTSCVRLTCRRCDIACTGALVYCGGGKNICGSGGIGTL